MVKGNEDSSSNKNRQIYEHEREGASRNNMNHGKGHQDISLREDDIKPHVDTTTVIVVKHQHETQKVVSAQCGFCSVLFLLLGILATCACIGLLTAFFVINCNANPKDYGFQSSSTTWTNELIRCCAEETTNGLLGSTYRYACVSKFEGLNIGIPLLAVAVACSMLALTFFGLSRCMYINPEACC